MAVHDQLAKSALFRWITARQRRVTEQDLRLFVGIVSQSRRLVSAVYPGAVFEILFWRFGSNQVDSALRAAGFSPRIAEEILPEYRGNPAHHHIPFDGHPNARADSVLARYIVRAIIEAPHLH